MWSSRSGIMEMPHAPRVGPHHVVSALRGLHDAGTTQPLYMTLHIDRRSLNA